MNETTMPGNKADSRVIPIEKLVNHPLNANQMAPDLMHKLKTHIRTTGLYPPIILRPHPTLPGQFEIIDGHHRVVVLRELGLKAANCVVWHVDDRQTRILLATLNRLAGQDQPLRRAQLIHELLGEMSLEDLAGLLPESDRQLEELHALLEFPAEQVAALLAEDAEQQEKTLPQVLTFVVTKEQADQIERAVELASDGTPGRDRKAKGLANLAAKFLAGEAA